MVGLLIIILLGIHIISAIISYGLAFAYCQKEFPLSAKRDYSSDRKYAKSIAVFGVLGLVILLIFKNATRGLKYK